MVVLYSVLGITSFDRYGETRCRNRDSRVTDTRGGIYPGISYLSDTRGEGDYTVARLCKYESYDEILGA